MFVLTEDSEILNLAQCLKIVVERNDIYAYTSVSDSLRSKNLVARFETEVEAGYAYFELFKALKAGKRTWDPYAIKPLSKVWDEIGKHFENSDVPNELTKRAVISTFHLGTITITHTYKSKQVPAEHTEKVERKLQELLGDTSIKVEWTPWRN